MSNSRLRSFAAHDRGTGDGGRVRPRALGDPAVGSPAATRSTPSATCSSTAPSSRPSSTCSTGRRRCTSRASPPRSGSRWACSTSASRASTRWARSSPPPPVARSCCPAGIHVLFILLVAMVVGALWAGLAGLLKTTRGISEVISTIMLNAIAITGIIAWLSVAWRDGELSTNSGTKLIEESGHIFDLNCGRRDLHPRHPAWPRAERRAR